MNKHTVSQAITQAFPKRPLSTQEVSAWKQYLVLFEDMAQSEEAEAFKTYGLKAWHLIPDTLILSSFPSIHSLPHEAFNYYLPRLMIAALEHPFEPSMERILSRLTDSSYSLASLSAHQRKALEMLCKFYEQHSCFNNSYVADKIPRFRKLLEETA